MSDKKIESLAYRLKDHESLRALFAELNFEFADKPVNKEHWNQDQINMVQEAKIIARKDDYKIYYIQTNTDSLTQWKGIATKIIKENNGLCLICSHNPSGFKWIFSSLSKDFSQSFTETRHVPIDIRPDIGVPQTFVEFLEKIKINKDSSASSIASQISGAFDSFAVTIHDELTVNVFEALKSLSEGIILDESNCLTLDENTLEEIREPIFILLYRIIFILYAEDRGIFPVEHKIYHEKFSFKWLKQEWLLKSENQKKLSEYRVHNRLWNFFRLIELGSEDLGYDSNEFFMRSYYGRIFDRNINKKLDKWKIKNQYLLDAISLLTRTRDKNSNYFFLDYSALETRHLGSIYEHLLEYHLTVKGKKIADLPDQQERKTTGSYYTPQYIVDHIVQNSVGSLIDSIITNTPNKEEIIEKILSLNILDPAMGSGHFLIGTVNYIAKRICEIEDEEITDKHLNERKRDVVRRCVYGVDVNPLAVDLAMVSLWLETLSSDRPLSFLSAHLKCGNSLVGAKMEILFDKQTTLMESQKGREKFKKTIKDFLMFENLEDDSANAVKTKMEKYSNIQSQGTIYYDLRFLLDCKTSESFGIKIPAFGDFKAKIGENSLDFYTDKSLQKVKELSTSLNFFHWELEFPDIFYDETGIKKSDGGFDIIIGNPPYIRIQELSDKSSESVKYFSEENFLTATKNFDLSTLFFEKSLTILRKNGILGFIASNKFMHSEYGEGLRNILSKNKLVKEIIDFGDQQVFPSASTYTAIIFLSSNNSKLKYSLIKNLESNIDQLTLISTSQLLDNDTLLVMEKPITKINSSPWIFLTEAEEKIKDKLDKYPQFSTIRENIFQGLTTSADPVYLLKFISDLGKYYEVFSKAMDKKYVLEKTLLKPLLKGSEVKKWQVTNYVYLVLFPFNKNDFSIIEKNELSKKYPKTYSYLCDCKKILSNRKFPNGKPPKTWYDYVYRKNIEKFENPKILTQVLAKKSTFALDEKGLFYFVGGGNAGVYGVTLLNKNIPLTYTCGLLNSSLLEWSLKKGPVSKFQRGFYSYAKTFQDLLPFVVPNKSNQKHVENITLIVTQLHKLVSQSNSLNTEKNLNDENYVSQIHKLESKLDFEVFKLFQIEKNEAKFVMTSLSLSDSHIDSVLNHYDSKVSFS